MVKNRGKEKTMQTMNDFRIGQYVIYHNESTDHCELGRIKSLHPDGAFVAYHSGETGAKTPYDMMHPIVNSYCIKETLLGGDYFEEMDAKENHMDQCKFKQVILDNFRKRLRTAKEYEDPVTRYAAVVSWRMAMSAVLIHLHQSRIISTDIFTDIYNEFETVTEFRDAALACFQDGKG